MLLNNILDLKCYKIVYLNINKNTNKLFYYNIKVFKKVIYLLSISD